MDAGKRRAAPNRRLASSKYDALFSNTGLPTPVLALGAFLSTLVERFSPVREQSAAAPTPARPTKTRSPRSVPIMSHKGTCRDNAVAETFFSRAKTEPGINTPLVSHCFWPTKSRQTQKAPQLSLWGFLSQKNPAATYSPTPSPVQYHWLRGA